MMHTGDTVCDMEKEIKDLTLEEAFDEIENLMDEMSDNEVSLEESFEKYKLGMELLKHCSDSIEKVETQIKILNEKDIV